VGGTKAGESLVWEKGTRGAWWHISASTMALRRKHRGETSETESVDFLLIWQLLTIVTGN
jgi:hypothetical protein